MSSNQPGVVLNGQMLNANTAFNDGQEYKGIYFSGAEKEVKYFDHATGAHFKFEDICQKLNKVACIREEPASTPSIIKIRKHKIYRLKQQIKAQKCCFEDQKPKGEYIDLKTKVLSRRNLNPDNKFAGTFKELLECNNQIINNKNVINLSSKCQSNTLPNQQTQESELTKAKIIESRRNIKHIISKGKNSLSHDYSETCDTRNLITDVPKNRSVERFLNIKTICDSQSVNSLRNAQKVNGVIETHKAALSKDFRSIPSIVNALLSRPPIRNKPMLAANSESKILLYKKNTMNVKLEKLTKDK